MVYHIFKGMVPKTNCKNIDLDLLKCYNTLFAIRHLADGGITEEYRQSTVMSGTTKKSCRHQKCTIQDGGIDPRFNRSCTGFTNSNFGQLFLN
ncbi:hypothetical protein GLOIN_2v1772347 [Rhizophagus irregularis DAOM 181602=DAOM 197198]|nr:hypothetical protein GLOIN_2v1772347 [Rhizophagus irregularis DAOM 181602=DAOM 197198]